jgi:gliding motility-associated-like protein
MKCMVKIFALLLLANISYAQLCIPVTAAYPYSNNFDTNNGGWISGGMNSDWAWGSPAKPLISGAASGANCWVTGGLADAFYNGGEAGWIMSPCFDLSTLQYPELRLKLFWETDRLYDGTAFQYSLDEGLTWTALGDINSNTHCKSINWYNTNTSFAGNFHSWSGNIQPETNSCVVGNGSGSWKPVRHVLEDVAGAPAVRFRFMFTSDTTCNRYDGFAIDDFQIFETSPDPVYFENVVCISADERQFFITGNCPNLALWDFGDPASGDNNSSILQSPVHKFSAPGIYNVTVKTATLTGFTKILNKEVIVIGADTTITWPGRCEDIPNATLSVNVQGPVTPYTYLWNTNPPQTGPSITNIGPGNYIVKINTTNACELVIPFLLGTDQKIRGNFISTKADCYNNTGTITSNITGGTSPFSFTWSNGASTANLQDLAPGTYSVNIIDATGCSLSSGPVEVLLDSAGLNVDLGEDLSICTGESLTLNAGNFDNYVWQDGSSANNFTVTDGGLYYVKVSNSNGCEGLDTVKVTLDCSELFFPSAFTPNLDNINEAFGPLGTQLNFVKNFRMQLYDRFGQLLFTSSDPFQKWNGFYKGMPLQSGAFVYTASYTINGRQRFKKGTALLVK